jgi:hypothetical protein
MTQEPSSQRPFVRLLEAADPRSNKLARAIELFGGLIFVVTLIYGYRNLPVSLPVVVNVALLVILFITLTSALQVIRQDHADFAQERTTSSAQLEEAQQEAARHKAEADGYHRQLQATHPELRKAAEAEIEARLLGLISLSTNAEAYLTLLPERVFAFLVDHAHFKIKRVRITVVEPIAAGETYELRSRLHSERAAAIHYSFEPSGSDAPIVQARDAVHLAVGKGETACRDEQHCSPHAADPFWRIATGFRIADDLPWYVFTFYVLGNETDHERERDYIQLLLQKQLVTALKLAYDRGNMAQLTEALAQKTSANTLLEQRLNHAQKVMVDVKLLAWSDPEDNPGYNKDQSPAGPMAEMPNISPEEYAEFESDPAKLIELEDNRIYFTLPIWKSRLPEPEIAHVLTGGITITSTTNEPRTINLGAADLTPALQLLQTLYDDIMRGNSGSLLNRRALESEWRKRVKAQPGNGPHNMLLIDVPPHILRDSDVRADFIARVERELRRCARTFHRGQSFEYDPGRYIIIGYDAEDDDTADDVLREAERLSVNLTRVVHDVEGADEGRTTIHAGVYRCSEAVLAQRAFQKAVTKAKLAWQSALQDQKPAVIEVDDVAETVDPEVASEMVAT